MAKLSDNAIALGLSLAVGLLIVASLLFPMFGQTFEYCQGEEPFSKAGKGDTYTNGCCAVSGHALTDEVTCTDCNQSSGYAAFLSTCGKLLSTQNATHCYDCNDWGQKTNVRGMVLIILVIGMFLLVGVYRKM